MTGRFVDSKRSGVAPSILALIVSSVALYFGTGLRPIWWVAWVAPMPVLLLAPRRSGRVAFAVALLAWAVGDLNEWNYFHSLLQIPLGVTLLIVLLPALVFATDVLVYRRVARTLAWRAALIFPSIWMCYEFVSESLSPHSTAGNISYSQMNFLPVLQLASVTGIWGISFCMFLFAATVSVLLSGNHKREGKRGLAIGVGVVFVVVLGFGILRLYTRPADQGMVEAGLAASDLPQNILTEEHADTMRLLRDYAGEGEKLAGQGAKGDRSSGEDRRGGGFGLGRG
jgi:apolipoprotein N-acyltransferase